MPHTCFLAEHMDLPALPITQKKDRDYGAGTSLSVSTVFLFILKKKQKLLHSVHNAAPFNKHNAYIKRD